MNYKLAFCVVRWEMRAYQITWSFTPEPKVNLNSRTKAFLFVLACQGLRLLKVFSIISLSLSQLLNLLLSAAHCLPLTGSPAAPRDAQPSRRAGGSRVSPGGAAGGLFSSLTRSLLWAKHQPDPATPREMRQEQHKAFTRHPAIPGPPGRSPGPPQQPRPLPQEQPCPRGNTPEELPLELEEKVMFPFGNSQHPAHPILQNTILLPGTSPPCSTSRAGTFPFIIGLDSCHRSNTHQNSNIWTPLLKDFWQMWISSNTSKRKCCRSNTHCFNHLILISKLLSVIKVSLFTIYNIDLLTE